MRKKYDFKYEIINESDIDMIATMANKYNMSIEDFGKLLSKKDKQIRHQIRFSEAEIKIVDENAEKLKMNRSEYCRRCYMKAIKNRLYENINISELRGNAYSGEVTRDIRVSVSFTDAEDYKLMRKTAKDLSLKFSTLLRYFALMIKL